jgi:exopolysaccharide biosynthesis polyprenyl glycosylphosphotransferase
MIRLFRVSIPASVLVVVVVETILLLACYTAATILTTTEEGIPPQFFLIDEGGWLPIVLVALVVQAGLYFQDLYDRLRPTSLIFLAQQISLVLGVAFLLQAVLGYARSTMQLPKWAMLYGSLFVLAALPLWRFAFYALISKALPPEKLLFLGTSSALQGIATRLSERPELGAVVIGYLNAAPTELLKTPWLGDLEQLPEVVQRHRPDRVIVGLVESRGRLPMQKLLDLRFSGISIEEAPTAFEVVFGRVSIQDLRPSQLIFSGAMGPRRWMVTLQTAYSMVLGIVGLIISLPVMAVVALVVRLSSPGPILLRQTRVGLHGKPFVLYKFRSMYADAEARSGAVWATKDDPRITPAGRWLRRLRLDELPQFLNVVRGEMSIVGPRPERPEFSKMLEEQIPFYRQRLWVKPGITGWAQINHKYGDTVEDSLIKLEYDLYYIKNLAPALDAYIVFSTLKVMLLSRGAH